MTAAVTPISRVSELGGQRREWPSLAVSLFTPLPIEQAKCPQRSARRHINKIRISSTERIHAANAAHHGDVLLAVFLPCHRLANDAGRRLEAPQHLAGIGVERLELTGHHARENEIARGAQGRREVWTLVGGLPLRFSGHRIDGLQVAADVWIVHDRCSLDRSRAGWLARYEFRR